MAGGKGETPAYGGSILETIHTDKPSPQTERIVYPEHTALGVFQLYVAAHIIKIISFF